MPGSTPPKQWTIDPANPTPADTIQFSGPTAVYSNSCVGERGLGGTPQILVDTKTKVVTLWFKGPVPQVCPAIVSPVAGLVGDFGPLPAGDWTFTCLSRDLSFEIHFTIWDRFARYVDGDAPGTVHDGTSWGTAMLTLQDALAAAGSGDEIRMAAGVYNPDKGGTATASSREASFMLKPGLKILGGFAGYGQPRPDARDPATYVTILSGDLRGNDQWGILNLNDNSYHVVVGPTDGLPGVLDGVTITGGNADGAYPHHYGGGLYNPDGKLQLVNCTFRGNTGVWGGAVMNFGPSVTLVNCQLAGNRALMLGGALYNYEGDATLINCRVVGNTADYAETAGGAAIYNLNGSLTVLDCTGRTTARRAAKPSRASDGEQLPGSRSRSPTASCSTAAARLGATSPRRSKSRIAMCRAGGPVQATSARTRSSQGPALAASRASGSTATIGSRRPPRPSMRAAAQRFRPIALTWMGTAPPVRPCRST
jgi:hypothetical protein